GDAAAAGAGAAGDGDRVGPGGRGRRDGECGGRGTGARRRDVRGTEGDGHAGGLAGGPECDGAVESARDGGGNGRGARVSFPHRDRCRRGGDGEARCLGDGEHGGGCAGDAATAGAGAAGDGDRVGSGGRGRRDRDCGGRGTGTRRRDVRGTEGDGDAGGQAGGREDDGAVESAGDGGGNRRAARLSFPNRQRGRRSRDREVARGHRVGGAGDAVVERGEEGATVRRAVGQVTVVVVHSTHGFPPGAHAAAVAGEGASLGGGAVVPVEVVAVLVAGGRHVLGAELDQVAVVDAEDDAGALDRLPGRGDDVIVDEP